MKSVGTIGFSDVVTFEQKWGAIYKYLGEGLSRWGNQTSEVQNSKYQTDRGAGSTVMKGRY